MSQSADAGHPPGRLTRATERVAAWLAVAGGILSLAIAFLVVTSVIGRWLFDSPINGDFEYVKMATAVSVFCFLPYCQVQRTNIYVDTFTTGLSPRVQSRIDGLWDIGYAAFMAVIAVCLLHGTLDALRSGETTMMMQIVIWPAIGVCSVLCALLALTAVVTAGRMLRGGR